MAFIAVKMLYTFFGLTKAERIPILIYVNNIGGKVKENRQLFCAFVLRLALRLMSLSLETLVIPTAAQQPWESVSKWYYGLPRPLRFAQGARNDILN